MPRFVILHHELPAEDPRESHWDLMLEFGDVLRTWALAERPDVINADNFKYFVRTQRLPDHRLAYLEYEGSVSGNRGSVTRWDAGDYELLKEFKDHLEFKLNGEHLTGDWVLLRNYLDDENYWDLGRL